MRNIEDDQVEWVVFIATFYHATPCWEMFTTYKTGDLGTVKMDSTSHSKIVGVSDAYIQTDICCTMTLKNVQHVPDLRLNLNSGTSLDRPGYENYFENGR